jgi:hypothetical protein
MRLLVINNAEANAGAGYADYPAITQILNYVGIPYTVIDVGSSTFTQPTLSDGNCHGYYQGIIYAFGNDIYTNSSLYTALTSYEITFGVRQLNWFTDPTTDFGLTASTGSVASTSTDTAYYQSAAKSVFYYANTANPITISGAYIYLTAPAAAGTATGSTTVSQVTPLLMDGSADNTGNTLSAITQFADGRQYLTQMFDSNPYLTHDLVLAYGLMNWVTKGVFLGDYHVYAAASADDNFISDSEWIPGTTCLANPQTLDRTAPDASSLPVFRADAADMTQLVTWQKTKQTDPLLSQFQLTLAFNGVGTTGDGDWTGLVAPITTTSASGTTATIAATGFSGLVGQSVTISGTTNGGGVFNGTFPITSVTKCTAGSAAPCPTKGTSPGTEVFTVTLPSSATLVAAAEPSTAKASVTDDLVSELSTFQQYFHWISHTYDHPTTLTGLCKSTATGATPQGTSCGDIYDNPPTDDIDLEILTNLYIGTDGVSGVNLDTGGLVTSGTVAPLVFTDFDPAAIVTPGITGLNDLNVPGYMYADGIRYAVTDTSVATTTDPPNNNGPNPSPNVGIVNSYETGIYEVPRIPNDVYYNVANWADDQAEFDCVYSYYVSPTAPAGTTPAPDPPFNAYNAAQVLDFTSSAFVTNMLMGNMDPEMFHQPDLHFSDNYANLTSAAPSGTIPASVATFLTGQTTHVSALLTDTYDLTFSKYEALYQLPVLSPTMAQTAALMQNRNSFNQSCVTGSIVNAGTSSATITLTVPATTSTTCTTPPTTAAVIPITGVAATASATTTVESYGGVSISHINMTPGQSITLPY